MESLMPLGSLPPDDRRASDVSLMSVGTDGNHSLSSLDSSSTITGRDVDDSVILSRIRKSLEQKEAFLRRPSQPTGWATPEDQQKRPTKEFYARPQKLQNPHWPPTNILSSKTTNESGGEATENNNISTAEFESKSSSSKEKHEKGFVSTLSKIQELTPSSGDSIGSLSNGSPVGPDMSPSSLQDCRYPIPAEIQIVTNRTRQFESPQTEDRTALYRSELARLSAKKTEPTVALRRKEYETRGSGGSTGSAGSRRDARSLDIQSSQDEADLEAHLNSSLSGNRTMIVGSKHLHCTPPEGYKGETEKVQMRARSNSTGSDGLPMRRNHTGYGFEDTVTRRQKTASHIAEEERAMRRVSYLKATWGDPLHIDSDLEMSDTEPLALRSTEKKSEESLSPHGSTEDDSDLSKKITLEGSMQVKMVLTNGKRASDRSWKQVWAVLQGPKLILHRHHQNQSPMAAAAAPVAASAGGATGGAADAFDLRFAMAAAAGDYTKRKHVLRVTCATGAELLLRADSAADAQRWLGALRTHARPPAARAEGENSIIITQTSDIHINPQYGSENSMGGLSPLPPQRTKKINRNRSPTGPLTPTLPSSPKTKTWKGRMAKQLRKMQGGSGSTGATGSAQQGGWLDSPLERWADANGRGVPAAVRACASAVEARGLHTVGVYRVPGNQAGVSALAAALDCGEPPPPEDPRWADVHVASSLLKAFFRRLPDSLLTAELYPEFVAADREPCAAGRARALRRLVRALPDPHYDTLEFLIRHLRRVAAECERNKMEARNLAIVFGPTLVRGADDDMLTMVNDMSSQCRIVESLINHFEWYFDECEQDSPEEEPPGEDQLTGTSASRALLIRNAKKIEGKADVSTKDIVSSIISAANRKIQRKPRSKPSSANVLSKKGTEGSDRSPSGSRRSDDKLDGSDETLESGSGEAIGSSRDPVDETSPSSIPYHYTQSLADYDGLPFRSYTGLNQTTQERIKRFEMETKAMLQREKRREHPQCDWTNNNNPLTQASPIAMNKLSAESGAHEKKAKAAAANLVSKEIAAIANAGKRMKTSSASLNNFTIDGAGDLVTSLTDTFDQKLRTLNNSSPLDDASIPYADDSQDESSTISDLIITKKINLPKLEATNIKSRQVSVDNELINCKKLENQRNNINSMKQETSSEKSKFNSLADKGYQEDSYDSEKENYQSQKESSGITEKSCNTTDKLPKSAESNIDYEKDNDSTGSMTNDDIPDNDKSINQLLNSPTYNTANLKLPKCGIRYSNPECVKRNSAVLDSDGESPENKSNKNETTTSKLLTSKVKRSESLNREPEKLTISSNKVLRSESLNYKADKVSPNKNKLQRSESLNKAENRYPLSNDKINRSESLNRSDSRLKRSDSLTKNEKTESNILKKRELNGGFYRSTKLKRKNGMPERSIKRRHTVGGTKDFDKDGWMDKHSRTSSPDLTDVKLLTCSLNVTPLPLPLESHV